MEEIQELMDPLEGIMTIGGPYLKNFIDLFDAFKSMKDAVTTLKTG